jgi:hypothetical protein
VGKGSGAGHCWLVEGFSSGTCWLLGGGGGYPCVLAFSLFKIVPALASFIVRVWSIAFPSWPFHM